jgi:CRISPR/Cas system CSM-associated protein Csm4 (group 5 of RAMP superfamily)
LSSRGSKEDKKREVYNVVFIQRKEDYGLRFLVGSRDKAISCFFLSICEIATQHPCGA